MARSVDLLCFLFLSSLWSSCNAATNTLKPGETLDSSSSLVSANGKFTLNFQIYDNELRNLSYLVIQNNASDIYSWIANRKTPILYPLGMLSLDRNNTLKITHRDGDAVVLYSPSSETINSRVVATLLDSGNFVLEEVSSDGLAKRVLWQSFDYPLDVLLPGMKLGVNHSSGHTWSLSTWLTEKSALPGAFSLDWDPDGLELKIRRRGVVYWSSGVFRDGSFEFIKHKRYNFSIVSNENEEYFTYTAVDQGAKPEWLLSPIGRLYDVDGSLDIAEADSCYGYNTEGGCQIWDQPTKCRRFGYVFEHNYGYFYPTVRNVYIAPSTSDSSTSLSISDCKAACWRNCDCFGFVFLFANQTGCRFWTGNLKFTPDSASYNSIAVYYLTKKSAGSRSYAAHKWKWIAAAATLVLTVLCVVCCLLRRRRKLVLSGEIKSKIDVKAMLNIRGSDASTGYHGIQNDGSMGKDLKVFSYESVMAATDNFSIQNKLGQGGFGPVYKGKLSTGREIAVKKLSCCSRQGELEFKNELILISELQHTNLVQLFGFCIHGEERMLIYEYMPNKSLDYILFDSTRGMQLDWEKRFNIIEGIAQGLLYLHKYSRLKVIHRDLKPSNILLDENMKPKISDFGTAKSFTLNEVEASTGRIIGTHGYMSPEYAMQGIYSGKSDVFSFGVLVLEIISGRKNNSFYSPHRVLNLVGYAWELWQEGAGLELMDATLSDSCVNDQLLRCIHVALLCVEENAEHRPTMSDAISMLTNESLPLPIPTRPAFFLVRDSAGVDVTGNESEMPSANGLSNSTILGR